MRKSAGKAALVIAPLAALTTVNEAKGQFTFLSPTINAGTSGAAAVLATSFSGSQFITYTSGGANGIGTARVGATGTYVTNSSGGALMAGNYLSLYGSTAPSGGSVISGGTIPISYDFTLTKSAGTIGNVAWELDVYIGANFLSPLATGTLTTGSASFTGMGNLTVGSPLFPGSDSYQIVLLTNYLTDIGDELTITMNPGSQGFTLNAAAIPEPSTYAAVFGLGALGFVMLRRSRRCAA